MPIPFRHIVITSYSIHYTKLYDLEVYSNGNSTPSGTISTLGPGNLPNNSTYVIAIGVAGTPDASNTCSITGGNGELADLTSGIGGINKKDNEHDAIRLLKSSGTSYNFV